MYQNRNRELDLLALFLGDYTKQLYLREISKLARLPIKTTQDLTAGLESMKLLKSAVRGRNKYFRLNLDNAKTKLYLLQSEARKTGLFMDSYPVFKTFLKELDTNATLMAFGSFAEFKANQGSDLDLLTVSKEKQKLPFHLLPYKIHEIEMSETLFIKAVEKQEALIKEIEEKHVILNNHSFYVNVMWGHYGK